MIINSIAGRSASGKNPRTLIRKSVDWLKHCPRTDAGVSCRAGAATEEYEAFTSYWYSKHHSHSSYHYGIINIIISTQYSLTLYQPLTCIQDLNHLRTHLTQQLNIVSKEDWYRVSGPDLAQHGARKLLNKHSGSPSATIRALFPAHEWLPWMFAVSAKGYWNNKDNQGKLLLFLNE